MAKNPIDREGNERIKCEVCGDYFHAITVHMKKHDLTVEEYRRAYPGAPIVSAHNSARMSAAKRGGRPAPAAATPAPSATDTETLDGASRVLHFGEAVLPIHEALSGRDADQVPSHDPNYKFWNKDALEAVATAVEMDLNLLMVGPTGCGKTSLVEELGALLNQPVSRVNMDGDIRSSDFLGTMQVVIDEATGLNVTKWVDGLLPTAMRNGWWLIIDEFDAAPAQILFALQAVLESGHRLVLKENGGEMIRAHESFRIIATANTLGRGDQSGMYAGTNVLNEATLDRFGIVLEYGYPTPGVEASIVRAKTGIDKRVAEAMCDVAAKVRRGVENGECYCSFSTRRILNWALLTVKLRGDHSRAARFTILERLGTEDREYVGGVIQRVLGA